MCSFPSANYKKSADSFPFGPRNPCAPPLFSSSACIGRRSSFSSEENERFKISFPPPLAVQRARFLSSFPRHSVDARTLFLPPLFFFLLIIINSLPLYWTKDFGGLLFPFYGKTTEPSPSLRRATLITRKSPFLGRLAPLLFPFSFFFFLALRFPLLVGCAHFSRIDTSIDVSFPLYRRCILLSPLFALVLFFLFIP